MWRIWNKHWFFLRRGRNISWRKKSIPTRKCFLRISNFCLTHQLHTYKLKSHKHHYTTTYDWIIGCFLDLRSSLIRWYLFKLKKYLFHILIQIFRLGFLEFSDYLIFQVPSRVYLTSFRVQIDFRYIKSICVFIYWIKYEFFFLFWISSLDYLPMPMLGRKS